MIFEEKLISRTEATKTFSDYLEEEWVLIVKYMILKLSEFLELELVYNKDDLQEVGNGFCVEFSTIPTLGKLNVFLKGTLGADIFDDDKEMRISAVIFLFCDESKLITPSEKSYIELEYRSAASGGNWESLGWKFDEYDEF